MITDTEARRIAADWHGGGGTALYAFASTGAINTARADHDIHTEINDCIADIRNTIGTSHKYHRTARPLYGLKDYVTESGTRGPQPGWSNLSW